MEPKKILKLTSDFYKAMLKRNTKSELYEYVVNKRKFDRNTIETFGIGISPSGTGLIDFLERKGVSSNEMQEFGLIYEKEGELMDYMSHRFTIEIRDVFGALIGFSGRKIRGAGRYKYLNTKTTPLFAKKKTVFNLDKAKYHIDYLNNPYLIVVEGYCDVMSLWQHGIKNVVAIMGTACTEYQARLIRMFCDKVVLCLDGDGAGQKAMESAEKMLNESGVRTYKAVLPDGKDGDELMQMENGIDLFMGIINKSLQGEIK